MSNALTDDDIREGADYLTLGPAYFASRRVCETAIAGFETEHLKPLVKKIKDEVSDALWRMIEDSLWEDTEMNLQRKMWRMVDDIVQGILCDNQPWIAKRYALGDRYDCTAIRRSLALSIKDELSTALNADLLAENEKLKKDLEWERQRR